MRICETCSTKTEKGKADARGKFVCDSCYDRQEKYLVNRIVFEPGKEPYEKPPFKEDRFMFIQYATTLFGKLNGRAYSQMKKMNEDGFSWLGMARALEYFYILKKNDIKKANGGIGIIPYVYEEANKYYERVNRKNWQSALDYHKAAKKQTEKEEVKVKSKKSKRPELQL